jgi:hypothetical protein
MLPVSAKPRLCLVCVCSRTPVQTSVGAVQASAKAPACKVNRMSFCHTDLGAVAYRWRRMVADDMRFGDLESAGRFTSQDALMAELVVDEGWDVAHLQGQCLFDQGPSPHMCARLGGACALQRLHLCVGHGWLLLHG